MNAREGFADFDLFHPLNAVYCSAECAGADKVKERFYGAKNVQICPHKNYMMCIYACTEHMWKIYIFITFSIYKAFTLTSDPGPPDGSVPGGKKAASGFSSASVTHVSGEIFIWPSTIRHSELERIIHSCIISLPLRGPLLSDLLAFPAFPQLRWFIPAAAAICSQSGNCCALAPREKDEIGTEQSEIRSAQVTVQTRREGSVEGAMNSLATVIALGVNPW